MLPKKKAPEKPIHSAHRDAPKYMKKNKKKKKKSLLNRALGEAWDVIEDIFD